MKIDKYYPRYLAQKEHEKWQEENRKEQELIEKMSPEEREAYLYKKQKKQEYIRALLSFGRMAHRVGLEEYEMK